MEWTRALLFKPFKLKKWLILGFVALLSGTLSSGSFNLNLPSSSRQETKRDSALQSPAKTSPGPDLKEIIIQARELLKQPRVAVVAGAGILLAFFVLALITWLHARFSFIFLRDVLLNDASVRIPFRDLKKPGNAFFRYSFLFSSVLLIAVSSLGFFLARDILRLTVFNPAPVEASIKEIILALLPYCGLFLLLIILSGVLWIILLDIVLPVMFKDNTGFRPAFRQAMKMISGAKKDLFVYILAKIVLGMGAAMIYMFISLASVLILIVPAILAGLIIYLIASLSKIAAVVFALAVVLPLGLCLMYCLICLGLPIAVFFRTFSLKFVGRLMPEYNLFNATGSSLLCNSCARDISGQPRLERSGEFYCVECNAAKKDLLSGQGHSPAIAASLSFVVAGLGQLYNGQAGKGILIFVTSCFIFPWIIGIFDAYSTARRLKEDNRPVKKRVGCMIALIIGILVMTVLFFISIVVGALLAADYAQKHANSATAKTETATERRE